jgi:tRNA1(Val) A37 N6-methylase TrmN6
MQQFTKIKELYQKFDKELRQNFRFVVRDTEKGIWGTSNLDAVFQLFKQIQLKDKKFIDIGCGDGRIVLVASLFTDATGIEIDKDLINKGNEIKQQLNLKANLIQDDFFKHDFSNYDILFSNPDTGWYNGLEDKLLNEMKPTATLYVYNNTFLPRILKRGKTHWINDVPITEFSRKSI